MNEEGKRKDGKGKVRIEGRIEGDKERTLVRE